MESNIDFGELCIDENFKGRVTDLMKDLDSSEEMLKTFFQQYKYDELDIEDKIRYDLFLAFAINSFYWMYLRTKGEDSNQHEIKNQINRVRDYMSKSKKIYEKRFMPKIDKTAAKNFIRSGLWMPNNTSSNSETVNKIKNNLKRKRDDTDD